MSAEFQAMLTIDGSYGEGGGQVLRTALALSAISRQPMRIERIRAGRRKPGLRPQHLTAVRAAATVCRAHLEGDKLGSQMLVFAPGGPPIAGDYTFDVTEAAQGGSAGSVGLVLQTVLLPLALADGESHLTLRGGTHVPWAPSVSYLEHVFLPLVARMGVQAQVDLARWGFYPAGGGEVQVHISGQQAPSRPIRLVDREELQRVWGTAVVMNLPAHIPQRMAARAHNLLAEAGLRAQVEPRRLRGAGPGAGIFLFAEYAAASSDYVVVGFTAYGRKGLPAERVAEAVCEEFLTHHRSSAPADPYLADQLVLPMVLVGITQDHPSEQPRSLESLVSTSRVSQHLLTNVGVVQQFLARGVRVEGELGEPGTIAVEGDERD